MTFIKPDIHLGDGRRENEIVYSINNLELARSDGAAYRLCIERLSIRQGEKIAITGRSGSGKSTALDILGMVLRPDSANSFLLHVADEAVDLAEAWRQKRVDYLADLRRTYIGYILQTGGLLPFLTVEENMSLTAQLGGMSAVETKKTVNSLAEMLGIQRLLASRPATLSVGERQRVAIGRAIAARPRIILADEPTAALDPCNASIVMSMLVEAADTVGSTLILVTHDSGFADEFSLRAVPIAIHENSAGAVTATVHDKEER